MRKTTLLVTLLTAVFILGAAISGYSQENNGGDIWFEDTKKSGPVWFGHDEHMKAGNQCADCHDGIFQKKAGSSDVNNALTMKAMREGKFCGTCHNGGKAFSVKGSCKKCHLQKQQRERLRQRQRDRIHQ